MTTAVLIGVVAVLAVAFVYELKAQARLEKEKREAMQKAADAEKQAEEVKEHAEMASEITADANKTKADARTGDHSGDVAFMAGKLHDYATAGKQRQ